MKIEEKLDKVYFNINSLKINSLNKKFEEILKTALLELEKSYISGESFSAEVLNLATKKAENVLEILDKFAERDITVSEAQTLGDWLLLQALELEKISESLPDSPQKELFKTSAFIIGIEAQKLKTRVNF